MIQEISISNGKIFYSPNKELYLTTIKDTTCLRFIHESTMYPRNGYRSSDKVSYTIPKNTKVKVIEVWNNFIEGTMIRVIYNNKEMDINPLHLKN